MIPTYPKLVRPGPQASTGKFETEERLREEVAKLRKGKKSYGQIAVLCEISPGTAYNIIKSIVKDETEGKEAQLKRRMMRQKW